MKSTLKFGIICVICIFSLNCSSPEKLAIEQGRQLYFQNKLDDALPFFQQATSDPDCRHTRSGGRRAQSPPDIGPVRQYPMVGGLHHRYYREAA